MMGEDHVVMITNDLVGTSRTSLAASEQTEDTLSRMMKKNS